MNTEQIFFDAVTDPFFWGYLASGVSAAETLRRGYVLAPLLFGLVMVGCMFLGRPL